MIIQASIEEIENKLKDEVEKKMVFQKEAKDNSNLVKMLEETNIHMETQLQELSIETQ